MNPSLLWWLLTTTPRTHMTRKSLPMTYTALTGRASLSVKSHGSHSSHSDTTVSTTSTSSTSNTTSTTHGTVKSSTNDNLDNLEKYDNNDTVTILGFGSLLSEKSSRLTFPKLQDFRLGRVLDHRRVFAHPASIFFQRGIADIQKGTMSSLSIEPCPGSTFIVSVFQVQRTEVYDTQGNICGAFLEREEEFDIRPIPFRDGLGSEAPVSRGIACLRSHDPAYLDRWGHERFHEHFIKYGIHTIWNWSSDSGLLPCSVYLRHCYLAAQSMGDACFQSFLNDTYLVDRVTTVHQYLLEHPEILTTQPPPELSSRYSG